ncbi:MAG: hypothetical protein ABSA13_07460 [Beijerinckiaceae bacterium]|jgi:hypothetical protein
MDASAYLNEIVLPTIAEFEKNAWSKRRTFLACVVTFHTLDYMPKNKGQKSLRKTFRDTSPNFAAIDRIAHAVKHVHSGSDKDRVNMPLHVSEVLVRPPAIAGRMMAGRSRCGDPRGAVLMAGVDVLQAVQECVVFLRAEIELYK